MPFARRRGAVATNRLVQLTAIEISLSTTVISMLHKLLHKHLIEKNDRIDIILSMAAKGVIKGVKEC